MQHREELCVFSETYITAGLALVMMSLVGSTVLCACCLAGMHVAVRAAAILHLVVILCDRGVLYSICHHIAWNNYPPEESSARKTKECSRGMGDCKSRVQ